MRPLPEHLRQLLVGVVSIDETGAFEDLDSLRIIDIVEIVEAEFDLRIAADQLTPDTFTSVHALADLIQRLKGSAP
jgi:acyl carrier protein